jgi:hypothetical protein
VTLQNLGLDWLSCTLGSRRARRGSVLFDQLLAKPLMKPFAMIMRHEFLDHLAEMALGK